MRRAQVLLLVVAGLVVGCRETVRLKVKVRAQDAGVAASPTSTTAAPPPGAPR